MNPFDAITAIGGIIQQIATGKLEREIGNMLASAAATLAITHLWYQGAALKWWQSEGEAFKMDAVALYKTLSALEKKGFLTITAPQEMLADFNRLAKFQTESIT